MKKKDPKSGGKKPPSKAGKKVSVNLTGPGLLKSEDLDEVAGGNTSTGTNCAVQRGPSMQTSMRC